MAGGFGKIGEMYKLQKEARAMQKKMKALMITGESKDGAVIVKINGLSELEDMDIEDGLLAPERKDRLIKGIKQAFKAAAKKLRSEMMKNVDLGKMRGMLGM